MNWILTIGMLVTIAISSIGGETASDGKMASRVIVSADVQYRFELTGRPCTQTLDWETNAVARHGVLIELTRKPANEGESRTGNTNLVWSEFFIKGADPREKWAGDLAVGRTPDEMILVVSSGTSFALFRIDPHRVTKSAPEMGGKLSGGGRDSSPTWLARPTSEMLMTMPQIDRVRLAVVGDRVVIDVVSPEERTKQYIYSLTEKQWQ